MNCCLQNYTTHQFTYFIYYLFQDKFKYPKIIKIQQVHQKIHAKQFLLFYLNLTEICPSRRVGHFKAPC